MTNRETEELAARTVLTVTGSPNATDHNSFVLRELHIFSNEQGHFDLA
jgi:hypothetical protein